MFVGSPHERSSGLRQVLQQVTEAARRLADDEPSVHVLRNLIDSLSVAALVADTHGRYVAVNDAASALTGYSISELAGLSVWQLTPNVNEHEAEVLWRAFLSRGEQHGDYSLVTKDHRVIIAEYAARTDVLPGLHVSLLQP